MTAASDEYRTSGDTVLSVFYDGQCPLCRREIAHYRRLQGADRIEWVDITHDDDTLLASGLLRETAMARFHVRDSAMRWHTGAYAFVLLWLQLPAYRWLARLLRSLRLLPLLDRFYSVFARLRLRRRCDQTSCGLK